MDQSLLQFIKAIGEPTRLRILRHLKNECCVGEIWKKLDLSQNLASHHLRVLKDADLISAEKRGLKVVYRLNERELARGLKRLGSYLE
ncbi:winged helix-turn-helix transcriptional regulator [Candidatus Falkowbacteria bacterium]|nr:winged helix-turn-helix transcriptional regulator [Candidatus Falkowbacteria bacterium]